MMNAARQYLEAGWYLTPIRPGTKIPNLFGYGLKENAITDPMSAVGFRNQNIGLLCGHSQIAVIDIDQTDKATAWLKERSIDLDVLLNASATVRIDSGRPNHDKLLFRVREGFDLTKHQVTDDDNKAFIDFRYLFGTGTSPQDLLPPSVNPKSGISIQWGGKGHWRALPPLPEAFEAVWREALGTRPTGKSAPPTGADRAEVESALRFFDPNCNRDEWLLRMFELHSTGEDWALEVFRCWSAGEYWWQIEEHDVAEKYDDPDGLEYRWSLLRPNGGRTIRSLFHAARDRGWKGLPAREKFNKIEGSPPVDRYPELLRELDEHTTDDVTDPAFIDWYRDWISRALPLDAGRRQVLYEQLNQKVLHVNKTELKHLVADVQSKNKLEAPSHGDLAESMAQKIESQTGERPVGADGHFWLCDKGKTWWQVSMEDMAAKVSQELPPSAYNKTHGHYASITKQLYAISRTGDRKDFFENAPRGLALGDRFLQLNADGSITESPLTPAHRNRFRLPLSASQEPPWQWMTFLGKTWKGNDPQGQIQLLQEVFGATLFGIFPDFEMAVFNYGAPRSGKSTIMKILIALVPKEFCSAIDPFKWSNDYHCAALAGKRLNVAGELPKNKAIPAADFKNLIGRDPVSARNPFGQVFDFTNEATHFFNSNHFIYTSDRTEAFWDRWVCFDFKNYVPPQQRDRNLVNNLVRDELPQILGWAIEGAHRIQAQGQLSLTEAHHKVILQWRNNTSATLSFLHDGEWLRPAVGHAVRRRELWAAFQGWKAENKRKGPHKGEFYDEVRASGLVTEHSTSWGDVFRGLELVDRIPGR